MLIEKNKLEFMLNNPAPWILNESLLTYYHNESEEKYLAYLKMVDQSRQEIGEIKTLKGSNNKWWMCYIPYFQATFKIMKRGKIIKKIWMGQRGKIKE
jgi:hypothetical protein